MLNTGYSYCKYISFQNRKQIVAIKVFEKVFCWCPETAGGGAQRAGETIKPRLRTRLWRVKDEVR